MGSLFGFTGNPDPELLRKIDDALRHRGGHRLLSNQSMYGTTACRPLDGAAPICACEGLFSSDDFSAAVVGYATNFKEFEKPLPEAVLEYYLSEGPMFITRFRGAYIIVIRDREKFLIFRDGAGARTVYYASSGGRFFFAVEPKGVWSVPGFSRRMRPGAVAQYLTYSFIPGSGTMLEGLYELPAGCMVEVAPGAEPSVRRHFEFEHQEKMDGLSDYEWTNRFKNVFKQAVSERIPAGEPVGLFLSGGIDSSVVAAELAGRAGRPVKSYAIHFGEKYPHELEFAKAVADRVGTEHEEVLIEPGNFLPVLRKIIWHLDDPIGDPITVPNFLLAEKVSKEVDWVFNGEGGDPLFGGPKNIPMLLHHWYGGVKRDANFREKHYLASYRRCYDDLANILTPDFQRLYDPVEALENILTPYFNAEQPASFVDKLQLINIRMKGAHLILPKVDRMTGAWKLRQMAPLFDERLIQMGFQMPVRLKLHHGVEKVILKLAYKNELPIEVIDRPKSGMRVPVHYWFQKEMKRYARKILSPESIKRAGVFNYERVKDLLAYDIEEGPGRYGLRLWMLITFEIWRRIVIEGESV